MTSYTKATNFAAKDSLASGNAAKVVKGTEIDTEFTNIETAVNSKSDSANPVFTGVAEFADGSASAPSITNTADTNTGIFFPAADTVGITTGGTERARVDSSGNLGLGVTPSAWGSGWKALQIGAGANFVGRTGVVNQLQLIANGYFNGTNYIYQNTGEATQYFQTGGYHAWGIAASGTAGNAITFTQAMTLDSSGNLLVGRTSGTSNTIAITTGSQGTRILLVTDNGTQQGAAAFFNCTNGGENAAATGMTVKANSSTGRSINAGGTINASGADYAEYMTKAGSFSVAKGDVVGINAEGKLTNIFADAVSFVVKSTDPSYVGGDVWGNEESLGLTNPEQPVKREATENMEAETDEEFAIRQAQYQTDKAAFEAALEVARQSVDRIAFAGQVPVNVTGATAGQYIVPTNSNGAIIGVAVNEADMTLSQYMKTVGKVIAIEQDGRAKIIVKVA